MIFFTTLPEGGEGEREKEVEGGWGERERELVGVCLIFKLALIMQTVE